MMQIYFQPTESARIDRPVRCAAALLALVLAQSLGIGAARSEARVSEWSAGAKSSVRLIAAPSRAEPLAWRAGVEIRLAKGALTYWRTPGGAGVPPVFDFTGSVNIAKVEVAYPAPTRIAEEGTDVYGYQGGVVFPLRLTPSEAGRPMSLTLALSYAVCERICLPAKANAVLDLAPRPDPPLPETAEGRALDLAEASVPQKLSERDRDAKISITAVAADPPSWHVDVHGGPAGDLFAEASDSSYFETRKAETPGAFLIVQVEKPASAGEAALPVTLTLTGPQRSYEFGVRLDSVTPGR
jgi:DsbC/DsbD-like thiol-disulfide interchange protein